MQVIAGTLASAVAPSGTFTLGYPTGYSAGSFKGGINPVLFIGQSKYQAPHDFTVSYGSSITITNQGTGTWLAGSSVSFQANAPGDSGPETDNDPSYGVNPFSKFGGIVIPAHTVLVQLGSPAAASATGVLNAVTVTASTNLLSTSVNIQNGAAAGRNVTVVSSNSGDTTQVVTITGLDINGKTLTQALTLNGTTSVVGTKAFVSLSSVVVGASTTGTLSVGYGAVLGLPVVLGQTGFVQTELVDNAIPGTAGTFVAADQTATAPTSTSGDPRGTYTPNSAPNGSHVYQLIVIVPDIYSQGEYIATATES